MLVIVIIKKVAALYNNATKIVNSPRDAIFIEPDSTMNASTDFISSSSNSEQNVFSIRNEAEDGADEKLLISDEDDYFNEMLQCDNESSPDVYIQNDSYEIIEPWRSDWIPKPNRIDDFVYSVKNLNDPDIFDDGWFMWYMDIVYMDAVNAFLQGEFDECIYIKCQEMSGISHNDVKVCKLNKSIYGLKI